MKMTTLESEVRTSVKRVNVLERTRGGQAGSRSASKGNSNYSSPLSQKNLKTSPGK
jgi:hypothetical protein